MQTVYLLKNCSKSYKALINLYNEPDISTNIIIVDKYQARLLYLDKRVKTFPFIINTSPNNIGLIPKIASVLPLEWFMKLKKYSKIQKRKEILPKQHNYVTVNTDIPNIPIKSIPNKISRMYKMHQTPSPLYKQRYKKPLIHNKVNNILRPKPKYPMIKKVPLNDGGINIILK
jgi:hypothetical protein